MLLSGSPDFICSSFPLKLLMSGRGRSVEEAALQICTDELPAAGHAPLWAR